MASGKYNKVLDGADGAEQGITTHGFDLSGLDIWTAGTLYKNISFQVLPSMGEGDTFHFESAWVRFDNLLNSPWLNVKFGKFELDNLLSEKRFLTLSEQVGLGPTTTFYRRAIAMVSAASATTSWGWSSLDTIPIAIPAIRLRC